MFSKYDTNHSGQLEFNEFLELFKDKLKDLQKVLQFISLKPTKSRASDAPVLEVTFCFLYVATTSAIQTGHGAQKQCAVY